MEQEVYKYCFWKGSMVNRMYNLIIFMFVCPFTLPCLTAYGISSRRKKQLIMSDVGSIGNMLNQLIFLKYYRNLFYHRIGRWSVLFSWVLRKEPHIIIPYSTAIGERAHFVHNYGSHLNAQSIGSDFICYQHVTIGANRFTDKVRPVIGNNVSCATGAVIVGKIFIGNNVKIGPNAFVNKSVPDNCTILGNPAYIVKQNGLTVNKML